MIEIEAPDGSVIEFPDGTPDSVITDVMGKEYGNPASQPPVGKPTGPNLIEKGIDRATEGAQLGMAFMQGRTFGIGPKVMSAIGAAEAKPILEGVELVNNAFGGDFDAPSLGDLYKTGVTGYQRGVEQSREDHPYLSPVAEMAGGLKTGIQFSGSKVGQAVDNWATGARAPAVGPLTQKVLNVLARAGRRGIVGEAGYRTYKVGTAAPGEEGREAVSGVPVGGIAGGSLSVIGDVAALGAPRIDDALASVANLAQKYEIPVSIAQITKSRPFKNFQKVSQELPFSGADGFRDKQMAAFNRAIIKTFGQDADRFSPELMNKAFKEVGAEFDRLGRGKKFPMDGFNKAVDGILDDSTAYSDEALNAFRKEVDVVLQNADDSTGTITGERLGHLRSRLNGLSRKTNDFDKQTLFKDLENAVIDLMTEGDDVAKQTLSEAKKKYKNLLVVEPLAQKAKGGNISPTELATRAAKIYGRRYTTGEAGEIGELARIGKEILPELGGSDTVQKALYAGGAMGGIAAEPMMAASALAGNAAFQRWVNQNPKIIAQILSDNATDQLLAAPTIPAIGTSTGVITKQ